MKNIKIYYSCPIRGAWGKDASLSYMQNNCNQAIKNIAFLHLNYPDVDWVCVAAHDKVVQRLYKKGYITEDQLLECDNEIQAECDGILAHSWETSRGLEKEIKFSHTIEQPGAIIGGSCEIENCDLRIVDKLIKEIKKEK